MKMKKRNRNIMNLNKIQQIYFFILILISLLITLYYIFFESIVSIKLVSILIFFIVLLVLTNKINNQYFNLFSFVFFIFQSISLQIDTFIWSFLFGPDIQIYFYFSNEFYISLNFLILNYDISFLYKKIFFENFIGINVFHIMMAIYYFRLSLKCLPKSNKFA